MSIFHLCNVNEVFDEQVIKYYLVPVINANLYKPYSLYFNQESQSKGGSWNEEYSNKQKH